MILFQNFLIEKIGEKDSNIGDTVNDIINYKINEARICTDWNHNTSLLDFLASKFSDTSYLNKTIGYLIENSTSKFLTFEKGIKEGVKEYLNNAKQSLECEKIAITNLMNGKIKVEEHKIEELFKIYEEIKNLTKQLHEKYKE